MYFGVLKKLFEWFQYFGILSLPFVLTSCLHHNIIDKVIVKLEPNLETIRVALLFSSRITSDLGGSFPVKEYGALEIDPATSAHPFSIGFRLNLNVLNDNEFVQGTPERRLPSGDLIPGLNGRVMAKIQLKNDLNRNFDILFYVEPNADWVGVVFLLNFVDKENFPPGLTLTKTFLDDQNGIAQASAAVFGPTLDSNGYVVQKGGLGLFANIRSLRRAGEKNP